MSDKVSRQARNSMVYAEEEAMRFQHTSIEPEHLLLGIIRTGNSAAACILISLNVDLNLVRTTIETYLNISVFPPQKFLRPGENAMEVTRQAFYAAQYLKSDYIGTDHLLLGLLQLSESVAAQVLNSYGITLEPLRQLMVKASEEHSEFYEHEFQVEPAPPILNEIKQQQANNYIRNAKLISYPLAILLIFLLVVMTGYLDQIAGFITGLNNILSELPTFNLQPVAGWYPVSVFVYFALIVGGWQIIMLPLNWFIRFLLPYHHHIQGGTSRRWLTNYFKERGWKLLNQCLFLELATLLLVTQPQSWWFWASLTYLLYTALMAYLYPVVIYRLFYTFTPLAEGPLLQKLTELTAATSTPVYRFIVMDDSGKKEAEGPYLAANAYLMGWGKTRSIAFTNAIPHYFASDEIVSIAAHEIGHHVHHDIWKIVVSRSLLVLAFLFSCNACFHGLANLLDTTGIASAPLLPGIFLMSCICILPIIAPSLYYAYRRHMEYQADEYALQATQNPTAFKKAKIRLANLNAIPVHPTPLRVLFSTHPPLVSRLKHADRFAAKLAKRRSTQRQSA